MRGKKYDIRIGRDEWLQGIKPCYESVRCIDDELTPIAEFLLEFESACDHRCCGIQAFEFWPKHIQRVMGNRAFADTDIYLKELISTIECLDEHSTHSELFHCVERETLSRILSLLLGQMEFVNT